MKVCFFGLGSIGRRHVKNLYTVCAERRIPLEVDAFRETDTPLSADIAKLLCEKRTTGELLPQYDAIFITNPTDKHAQTLQEHLYRADCFFIEKPIFELPNALQVPKGKLVYTACPLRYSGVVRRLGELLPGKRVCSAIATCSSYLPDWRQGVDYRTVYSAHEDMGGGVHIDLIHEMDYICHLFGLPQRTSMACGRFSSLEIDSMDLATYQLTYPDKIVLIHLDYFGVSPQRDILMRGDGFVLHADFLSNSITTRGLHTGETTTRWQEAPNDMYLHEMEAFLDCMAGAAHNQNDISLANQILALALGGTV